MCKLKKIFLVIVIAFIPIQSSAATVFTTDDLRVLMGMNRLSDDGSMKEIKYLLSSCYKQKEWNELVLALGGLKNLQLEEFEKKEEDWYTAKDILETNFMNNEPIKTILNDFVNYQTANSLRSEYTMSNGYKLSLKDMRDIENKIAYANSLLDAVNDNTNIGVIGQEMKTFTQANLLILIPFGNSYSVESGEKQVNDGLTISIQSDYDICSQFNGEIVDVTDNSVTVRTGKSIEIEYIGIRPCVEKGQKVKQYSVLGRTKAKTMTIKFKLNTVYVDPLLLYGSRSNIWYMQWENSNPGCTIEKNDYSYLLDILPIASTDINTNLDVGKMISDDGSTNPIIIQGENNYADTPDNIILENAEPDIITNEK